MSLLPNTIKFRANLADTVPDRVWPPVSGQDFQGILDKYFQKSNSRFRAWKNLPRRSVDGLGDSFRKAPVDLVIIFRQVSDSYISPALLTRIHVGPIIAFSASQKTPAKAALLRE